MAVMHSWYDAPRNTPGYRIVWRHLPPPEVKLCWIIWCIVQREHILENRDLRGFKDGPQLCLCATWPRRPAGYNNIIPIPHIKAVPEPPWCAELEWYCCNQLACAATLRTCKHNWGPSLSASKDFFVCKIQNKSFRTFYCAFYKNILHVLNPNFQSRKIN